MAKDKAGWIWGTGRRKSAVARVRLRDGSGKILVNDREVDAFFTEEKDRNDVVAPLAVTQMTGKVDIFVNVSGGGYTGQAGAMLLGIARALKKLNPDFDHVLRDNGFLTRDSREVGT